MKETKPRFDKSDNMPLRPRPAMPDTPPSAGGPAVSDPFFADGISPEGLELIPSTPGLKAAKRDETWQRCGSGWKRISPTKGKTYIECAGEE